MEATEKTNENSSRLPDVNARESDSSVDLSAVDAIVARIGTEKACAIPILTAIQENYKYLPEDALRRVCQITEITPAAITGIATFYSYFRLRPAGKHLIKVCVGTACHIKGASRIKDAILRFLNVPGGDDGDAEGMFTVTEVACLGCCTLAPAVQIDDVTYGHLTTANVGDMIEDFIAAEKRASTAPGAATVPDHQLRGEIKIGLGSCCVAGGSLNVKNAFETEVRRLGAPARVKTVGCVGMCHQTPLVEIVDPAGASNLYAKVSPDSARAVVSRHFRSTSRLGRWRAAATAGLDTILSGGSPPGVDRHAIDVRDEPVRAFLDKQRHIATANCGSLDPLDLDEYMAGGGYEALRTALSTPPDDVIETIRASGLRGRGGGGFPTGEKWALVRRADNSRKFVVMNGDEGDPGAFMDRMLLESFPHRILEGIVIAARAVGAAEGVLYIRKEYPLALERVRAAMAAARRRGFLGDDVLGSGFALDLRIMEGAGAFVCGEETALIKSIEGERGNPRRRPPYPTDQGLRGAPTLVNNVETFACVPWIVREGAEAFARLGSKRSKGTKVFSLTGKINRGGLIEVPMGITIREIVETVGGGVQDGKKLKAVQIGGPSGGCVPAELCDTPIDYEELTRVGAIMGSGGLVVLDESDCMVDVAKYFLQFTQDQSCGKCVPCRVGTKRMLEILEAFCQGEGTADDLAKLENLAILTKTGSLCGLGRTAPNPVLSTLRYFRDEYEAHVKGVCPVGKCPALVRYFITDDCVGCTRCAQACPADAIAFTPYQRHVVDDEKCVRCDMCRQGCPVDAVRVESPRTSSSSSE